MAIIPCEMLQQCLSGNIGMWEIYFNNRQNQKSSNAVQSTHPTVQVRQTQSEWCVLRLWYSDSASWSSPIFWATSATLFHVGEDFLSHISRISFRHSSCIPLLLVKISSMRSSSTPSTSASCFHLGVTAGCRTSRRFSKLTGVDGGWTVACPLGFRIVIKVLLNQWRSILLFPHFHQYTLYQLLKFYNSNQTM